MAPSIIAQRKPEGSRQMQRFADRMAKAGFYARNLQVELPDRDLYNKSDNGALGHMNLLAKGWYKLKSVFKDENSGVMFPDDYFIFNRNAAGEKSNFFVLAKCSALGGLEVLFTNPLDPDKGGRALRKKEVVLNLSSGVRTSEGFEKWAGETVALVSEIAANKPEDKYYAQMHGHFGYSRGKLLMDLSQDDGRSGEMDIVLNMALWHTDFDATGPHNHHFPPLYEDVKRLEQAVGIVKVPACEVTMPVHLYNNFAVERFVKELNDRRGALGIGERERIELPIMMNGKYALSGVLSLIDRYGAKVRVYNASVEGKINPVFDPQPEVNGPHVMLYAGSEGLMGEIMERYLSRRTLDYPPYAPAIQMREFMMLMQSKYWGGVAFMIAHPACSLSLPKVGMLNRMSIGDITLSEAEEAVRRFVQGVAAFNPTISDKEETRFIPYDAARLSQIRREKGKDVYLEEVKMAKEIAAASEHFTSLLERMDAEMGIGTAPTHNALNLAWAEEMREKSGAIPVFDGDCHHYVPVKIGRDYIGLLGFGRTAMEGRMPMTPEAFVSAFHSAKEGKAKMGAEIYWDSDNELGSPVIVSERKRNTLWEQVLEGWGAFKVYGISGVPVLVRDLIKSIRDEKPGLFSPQEWFHAAFRLNR